jgi:hypothetical protein
LSVTWLGRGRATSALLAAAALVIALAGCGGSHSPTGAVQRGTTTAAAASSGATPPALAAHPTVVLSKSTYVRTLQRFGMKLSTSVQSVFPIVDQGAGSASNAKTAARVEAARAVVMSIATSISKIVPPSPIRADHERLISALSNLGGQLDRLVQVLERGGSKPLGSYTSFTALYTISRATSDMVKKGYAVG